MNNLPTPEDLRVFVAVVRKGGFSLAANEMGTSPAYISKRIRILEEILNCRLFARTTRVVAITQTGERVYRWAEKILNDVNLLYEEISDHKQQPRGPIRICSSFGFGRNHVGPAISSLMDRYPLLSVRFEVFSHLVDLAEQGFDLDIRIGDEISPQLIAKRLGSNHRILCASPSYLKKFGAPASLAELELHKCLIIKERDHPFGIWRLCGAAGEECVKVKGKLSTNHGEIAVAWAIEGHGIVLRSVWDLNPHIRTGQLIQVLPAYSQPANIWAVYSERADNSAKISAAVAFFSDYFSKFE